MFTGIIQAIGTIEKIEKDGDWLVRIAAPFSMGEVAVGTSIACDGICLTVIAKTDRCFDVQLSGETVGKTRAKTWSEGGSLNLERSLKLGDEMAGHIVSGHVDGVLKILSVEREQDSLRYRFEIPQAFAFYLAPKGSIALDGISLTINEVEGRLFGVNVIPHTQTATTIGSKKPGDLMNFEIDTVARYVGTMLKAKGLCV